MGTGHKGSSVLMMLLVGTILGLAALIAAVLILTFHYIGKDYK